MLNGRFSFIFPAGTKWHVGAINAETNNAMTFVEYKKGDREIVCIATDLNSFYTADLLDKLRQGILGGVPETTREIHHADSVIIFMLAYKKENNLLITHYQLVIKNADNTLSLVQIFDSPKTSATATASNKIVLDIISSFKKGSGQMNLNKRIEKRFILGTRNLIEIPIPSGYTIQWHSQLLENYETYQVTKLISFGKFYQPCIIINISVNRIENTFHGDSTVILPETPGEFMGIKGNWFNYYDQATKTYFKKQLFADEDISNGAMIGVEMIARSQDEMEELAAIVKMVAIKTIY